MEGRRVSRRKPRRNPLYVLFMGLLALSLVLVYMLLAVLYESLLTPLIRMFSLPLGLIGSLLFLAMRGLVG